MPTLLHQKSREMIALKRQLKRETARRESAENSLKTVKQSYGDLLKRSRRAREEMRVISHRLLLVHEEERRQISRALHDEISQTLAGINVKLATLTQEASAGTRNFKKKISAAQRLVERSVIIVHRFARGLRPTMLDDLGLIPALHAYMDGLTRQTGLRIRFTAYSGVEKLGNAKRTAFYRIAQSALTNVAQHAKASEVDVVLNKSPQGICLEVKDDGVSFQVDRILASKRYKRLGLISMRERIEMFGGTFTVVSLPGQGTTLRACIPYDRSRR